MRERTQQFAGDFHVEVPNTFGPELPFQRKELRDILLENLLVFLHLFASKKILLESNLPNQLTGATIRSLQ